MGIYDKKIEFGFLGAAKQFVPFIIAIVALIALFLLFTALSELAKPQAITASFSENPLEMANGSTFTKLSLTITNVTGKNAQAVAVEVKPENSQAIIVSPAKTDLGLVENGNRRETEFIVRPNPSKTILGGTYTLNIYAVMNGERFQKQVVLEIKTA